ncbi:hypothetical protein ACWEKR_08230 [Nocardia sp. NPDC004573]
MDGIDTGRLISFATKMSVTPGRSGEAAEYERLITRYQSDAEFQQLVDDFLEGAQCAVSSVRTESGLILRSDPDGPWCWPEAASELPWNKNSPRPAERACRMLVIPALLAFIAPSAADLEDLLADPTLRPPAVPVRELEEFIRTYAEYCDQQNPDPDSDDPPVWWQWLQLTALGDTPTQQRASRVDTTHLVYDVLLFLSKKGLLSKSGDTPARDTVFRPKRRILAHYEDMFCDEVFVGLQKFSAVNRPDGATGSEIRGDA